VHAFGVLPGGQITHARTFTGASWTVDPVGSFQLSELPVSAAGFADRLHIIGVKADQLVSVLAYTVDGGSWAAPVGGPPVMHTLQAGLERSGEQGTLSRNRDGTGLIMKHAELAACPMTASPRLPAD
jgi:hypothetical protein